MPDIISTPTGDVEVQAAAKLSWEHALRGLVMPSPRVQKHLMTLLRTGCHLAQVSCPNELFRTILDETVGALNAQRGCILLYDPVTQQLQPRTVCAIGRGVSPLNSYNRTLAQRSFQQGESLLCRDAARDADGESAARKNMASIICVVLRSPRQKLGVLHLDRGPLQEPFNEVDFSLANAIAASVSAALEIAHLLEKQRELHCQLVTALARATEFRDPYFRNHSPRVVKFAMMLAEELRVSDTEKEQIEKGVVLRDIGKIGIADSILNKCSKLTAEEYQVLQSHPVMGASLLGNLPNMVPVIQIVRHHHERWDGGGYPDHLAGPHIPKLARIVAIADAFDSMISSRPYRPALALSNAFAEIATNAGSHFAPECAAAFLRLRPRLEAHLAETGTPR